MTDIADLLKRQAEWQRSPRRLSWAEKVRMAERVRDSVALLKRARTIQPSEENPSEKQADRTDHPSNRGLKRP